MTGKEFLDEKYGAPRGNGYGIAKLLDEFGEIKILEDKEELVKELKLILERADVEYVKELLKDLIKRYEK